MKEAQLLPVKITLEYPDAVRHLVLVSLGTRRAVLAPKIFISNFHVMRNILLHIEIEQFTRVNETVNTWDSGYLGTFYA